MPHDVRTLSELERWAQRDNPEFGKCPKDVDMPFAGKEMLDFVYRYAANGSSLKTIANAMGVSLGLFKRYFDSELGFDVERVYNKARARCVLDIEETLVTLAKAGDFKSLQLWLKNRNPDDWGGEETQDRRDIKIVIEPCEQGV